MPHPILIRRTLFRPNTAVTVATTLSYLRDLAVRDGATLVYNFDESSLGTFANYASPGNWTLNGTSGFTVATTGRVTPDLKSVTFHSGTQSVAPYFGHIQGRRPPLSGSAVSVEWIARIYTGTASRYLVECRRQSGQTLFSISSTSTPTMLSDFLLPGGNNSQIIASNSAEATVLAHYVARWNGTTYSGLRNGTSKFSVTPGTGGSISETAASVFGLSVGGLWDGGANNSNSVIDFLAFYPTTHLSDSQVQEHYLGSGL